MIVTYLQALGGLVLLVVAGDLLVRGAVSLSQRLGVPTLLIGLTVVAFGTSAPELFVGIESVLTGHPTLALGNVVGSNIANIMLVIALPALVTPMICDARRLVSNMVIMLSVTLVFVALAMDGMLGPVDGILMLVLLTGFLAYAGMRAKSSAEGAAELAELDEEPDSAWLAALLLATGLAGLTFGAQMLIGASVLIAVELGVREEVIGLTLVAIGTSLPELVTAVAASLRRECDVAVGNVIGSNIFNLLAIIGISTQVGEIPVPMSFRTWDLWIMLASSAILLPYCIRRAPIGRWSGIAMIVLYTAYLLHLMQHAERMKLMMGQ